MNLRGYFFTTIVGALAYWILLHQLTRENFGSVFILFTVLFGIYIYLIQTTTKPIYLFLPLVLFHTLAFASSPHLSDDYWRFLWDGHLTAQGISPYLYTPSEIMETPFKDSFLHHIYPHLNSPNYYSVYPPAKQVLFRLSAFGATPHHGILILKTVIILGNALLFFVLHLLSKTWHLTATAKWFVLLNPLFIVETTGNLHFEGITLALFVCGLYLLIKDRKIAAGILFGLSVSVKLVPLLFLPFVFKHFGFRKSIRTIIPLVVTLFLTAVYFINPTVLHHFFQSLNLYFRSFEFNASVYSIVNASSSFFAGHNTIYIVGPLCTIVFLGLYGYWLYRFKPAQPHVLTGTLFTLVLLFYALSTTVHPWYALYPLVFGVLALQYNYIAISYFVFLSYGFYTYEESHTTTLLTSLEYVGILLFLFHKKIKTYSQSLLG